MKRFLFICLCYFSVAPGGLNAQVSESSPSRPTDDGALSLIGPDLSALKAAPSAVLTTSVTLPRMAPEFALQVLQGHAQVQSAGTGRLFRDYGGARATSRHRPIRRVSAEAKLLRAANAGLRKALRFTGDNFVKSNIILRVLQSEVDHVQKDDPALTAISAANYSSHTRGPAS